jgi:hypothetical protein
MILPHPAEFLHLYMFFRPDHGGQAVASFLYTADDPHIFRKKNPNSL